MKLHEIITALEDHTQSVLIEKNGSLQKVFVSLLFKPVYKRAGLDGYVCYERLSIRTD